MSNKQPISGSKIFQNAYLNRGLSFTLEERKQLGLEGLLPPVVSTRDQQAERMRLVVERFSNPLDKFLFLDSIRMGDENLFFKMLIENIDEYMPLVYTPTVGEACQKFSHLYREPRGLYVSINDKGNVKTLIDNCPNDDVDVIVVTDGQRILGLGDQGLNGMGIPIGKLALYTACAGIHPERTLPVTIDVGTNNAEYLADPMYLGLRHERVSGQAYDDLVEEFVVEARRRWPNVLIQFEDFGNNHAFDILNRYQDKILCFNDDIQGTASVAVTGVFSALRVTKQKLDEQRFLFLGAGEAATGIATLIADAMVEEGMDTKAALAHCALFDSKGLVTASRTGLAHNKIPFAHDLPECKTFVDAIRAFKPTGIIGVSAQPSTFTAEVLAEMAKLQEHPIIFALSNPTSRAECTAEEAYVGTKGKALFASGSPFAPVEYAGKTYVSRQGNNSYVFPGLGLGAVFTRATSMPTGMFLTASRKLAELVTQEDLDKGALYPPLSSVREVSIQIAIAVAEYAFKHNLATVTCPENLEQAVRDFMYEPQ